MRMIFANIGWMTHYEGRTSMDTITGGGSYTNDDKHEVYNFKSINNKVYGYVQPKSEVITLSRIAESCDEDYLDDVLVVWIAKNPNTKGSYIVGWYKHATVYTHPQKSNDSKRNKYSYNTCAWADNVCLLPVDERTFNVPRAKGYIKGFLGQSNVWYADANVEEVVKFRKEVLNYINTYGESKSINKSKHKIAVNVDAKIAVEKAAVEKVALHYKSLGYRVKSVEKDNVGWDLDVSQSNIQLKVEVKGLASDILSVHISGNEYRKMNANKSSYRLCVVLNALSADSDLLVFLWDGSKWICEDDSSLVLDIEQVESYIAEVKTIK